MKTGKTTDQQKKRVSVKPVPSGTKDQGFFMKNKELLMLVVVVIVTFVIYYPALHHKFTNWDDLDYVTENPYIKALTPANLNYMFTKPIALNYHPLTILSLALNYRVSGTEPFSYFLVNIIFHLFNTLLVFYLVFLLPGRNKTMALFVAAIFAVHPMHVESVAWISERKDVLYTFFYLSGMISWILYIPKRHWYWYLCSLVLFVLAGLAKPSAVVFPLILLLTDFLYHRRFSLWVIAEKIPFFAVSIAIGMATLHAQIDKSVVAFTHYNAIQQFLFASFGFFTYIFKLFIPVGLSALHPVPVFNTSLDLPWIYFVTPVINILLVVFALYSMKYTRMLFFCLMFYFLNIMLTLQFMQVGSAVIAERYTYISYIGLLAGIAWLADLAIVQRRIPGPLVYLVMVMFFGTMTILAIGRVAVWENSGTLWTDVIEKYPKSHTAYNNRGYYYVKENMLDQALPDFTKSLEILPAFADALNNRGSLYRLQNLPRLAIGDYNRVLAIDSNHVKALSGRGNAYATLGVLDSALADYNKAYRLNPALATSLGDRGAVFFRLGQYENAIEDCSRKITAEPGNISSYLNRGVAYSSLRKWDLAIKDYTVVINAHTDNPAVYEWRGVSYRNIGAIQLAINDFTQGIRLNPAKSSLFTNRALAYEEAGLKKEAAADMKRARELEAGGK
ncbi:MAG: tetratricopeptide repeat protein [Bacteroidetes bacterium]|nr:tetratricopeptide repeat protein [Bacteroidota bacterium]